MSSIYKKGRDGYYYYQTYVYNPESKKKDKRIFHALGTKDLQEAKTKQHELDLQHEKQNDINSSSSKFSNNFRINPTITIIAGSIIITIFLVDYFRLGNATSGLIINEKTMVIEEKIDVINTPVKIINEKKVSPIMDNIAEIIKTAPKPKLVESNIVIPKYTIERVDRLSGAFEQGKLYVTINKNSSNKSQQLLCKNLVKSYSEFSNIVICLYANNSAGKNLARGNNKSVSIEEQKQFWLAMYTYNSVEGEYFDDNPSGYLGIY